MTTRGRRRLVYGQTAWMLLTALVLSLLGLLSLETFFVVSFVGFLLLAEESRPSDLDPRWRTRLRWIVLLGLLGFGYVVVHRILDILSEVSV